MLCRTEARRFLTELIMLQQIDFCQVFLDYTSVGAVTCRAALTNPAAVIPLAGK